MTAAHPSLLTVTVERDLSAWITRAYSEGGGSTAAAAVTLGETILPLAEDAPWYEALGGVVACGPQRLTYGGRTLGGGGSLVGPGASPSVAPVAAGQSGSGIESGVHDYAATFVTGSGESLAGPSVVVTVGLTAAPTTAPTTAVPTAGGSVEAGDDDYQVTFVTASGETTPGPASAAVTAVSTGGPSTAPVGAQAVGGAIGTYVSGNLGVGIYQYQTTFITAAGESGPSSAGSVTIAPVAPPNAGCGFAGTTGGSLTPSTPYAYYVSFVTAAGETPYVFVGVGNTGPSDNAIALSLIAVSPDARVTARRVYRQDAGQERLVGTITNNTATTFTDTVADGSLGAIGPTVNTAGSGQVEVSSMTTGPVGTTARKLYRTELNGLAFKLVTTLSDNVTTTYADNKADLALGVAAPTTGATLQTVPLTALPLGPATVTARRLYRRFNASGTFKLVTTIANNTATTYTDTTANAGLGVAAPATNTATANQVALSSIPIGAASVTARRVVPHRRGRHAVETPRDDRG